MKTFQTILSLLIAAAAAVACAGMLTESGELTPETEQMLASIHEAAKTGAQAAGTALNPLLEYGLYALLILIFGKEGTSGAKGLLGWLIKLLGSRKKI